MKKVVLAFCMLVAALEAHAAALPVSDTIAFRQEYNMDVTTPAIATPATDTLASFWNALAELESGERQHVKILLLGDSHTAGELYSGRLRQRLQERFGDAGPGWLAAGRVHKWYRSAVAKVSSTPSWQMSNSFSDRLAKGYYGLGGYSALSEKKDAQIQIEPQLAVPGRDTGGRLQIFFMSEPKSGSLRVISDGFEAAAFSTASTDQNFRVAEIGLRTWPKALALKAEGDGKLLLTGLALESRERGLILDAIGINGAQVNILQRWDEEALRKTMRARDPQLVMLAFGTNEGFEDKIVLTDYAREFRRSLALVREALPNAAVLILGAPDGQKIYSSECRKKKPAERAAFACRARDERGVSCAWEIPPNLAAFRKLAKEIAAEQNLGFWDWSTLQGGPCAMHKWTRQDEPLAGGDHVHFTKKGYQLVGDVLFDALMKGYQGGLKRP